MTQHQGMNTPATVFLIFNSVLTSNNYYALIINDSLLLSLLIFRELELNNSCAAGLSIVMCLSSKWRQTRVSFLVGSDYNLPSFIKQSNATV